MALTLNTNYASLLTQQYLNTNSTSATSSLSQLSSGSKLNSAADDPADYAIAFKLGVKSASLTTAINNGNQASSMLQTAQSGMSQIGSILTQLKQIATEAASSNTDSSTLPALDTQRQQLETEINNIAASTQYGGVQLLQGGDTTTQSATMTLSGIVSTNVSSAVTTGAYSLTISAPSAGVVTMTLWNSTTTQSIAVTVPGSGSSSTVDFSNLGISMNVSGALTATGTTTSFTVAAGTSQFTYQIGSEDDSYNQITVGVANLSTTGSVLNLSGDVTSLANAQNYMNSLDTAITNLDSQEGSIGAYQNEISYQVSNMTAMNTNTQSAESTIKDTDYASAMSKFTQSQIAEQADVSMLTQANSLQQQILTLVKG